MGWINDLRSKKEACEIRERVERYEKMRAEEDRRLARLDEIKDALIKNNGDYTQLFKLHGYDDYTLFTTKSHLYAYYKEMDRYLSRREWHLADECTAKIMKKLIFDSREREIVCHEFIGRPILSSEIGRIPFLDLLTLERMWCQYSNARFGFSIQYRLFCEAGKDFSQFVNNVDWRLRNHNIDNPPPSFYPNWLFRTRDEVLLINPGRTLIHEPILERTYKEPEGEYEYDDDWYEDRYGRGARGGTTLIGYKDGWKRDPVRKDWFRTVSRTSYRDEYIVDPFYGMMEVFSLLEKYDLTEPEKLLYHTV